MEGVELNTFTSTWDNNTQMTAAFLDQWLTFGTVFIFTFFKRGIKMFEIYIYNKKAQATLNCNRMTKSPTSQEWKWRNCSVWEWIGAKLL